MYKTTLNKNKHHVILENSIELTNRANDNPNRAI